LVLALVLLAGLIPAGVLSAVRACNMACCAGKPPHQAGACNFVLPGVGPEEPPPAAADGDDEHSSHHAHMEMDAENAGATTETIGTNASSDHCRKALPSQPASTTQSASPSTIRTSAQTEQATVSARAFDKPCSMECAAAVLNLSPGRQKREAAALSTAFRPRPPTLLSRADHLNPLFASTIERRRQSRPRAPPSSLVNLSA
jgi:uncharacterized protein involved in copper resistance